MNQLYLIPALFVVVSLLILVIDFVKVFKKNNKSFTRIQELKFMADAKDNAELYNAFKTH